MILDPAGVSLFILRFFLTPKKYTTAYKANKNANVAMIAWHK